MIKWIKNEEHLKQVQKENNEFLVLAFYGSFSQAANER